MILSNHSADIGKVKAPRSFLIAYLIIKFYKRILNCAINGIDKGSICRLSVKH